MPTHNQEIMMSGAPAQSLITMAQSTMQTGSSLVASFNTTPTEQTALLDAAIASEVIITMARTANETEIGLTAAFNTEFVGVVVFDKQLPVRRRPILRILDVPTNPTIISSRGTGQPVIVNSRISGQPVIFHSKRPFKTQITQNATTLQGRFNTLAEVREVSPSVSRSYNLITIAKTHDEADSSLSASFSTAVA